ncbi:histidine phosphatase family protein [Flavimaricola marinus]|uniref:Bifunctional RNase H/acid phosphatase n=1 Tax=Flavimaricola marinus TaxID=1819565 RepID=A0A238LHY1_9RHOB|nr:histidine phosphatase family protein [Flavimaricola marinus]SMY09014.1 bifunctional RNase H/acid phosphatase [Flavimaricola marinus]
MGTITFIRHGQANSTATDEESYDQLSDLGRQQAAWLGEWLRDQGESFDQVISGSLTRHKQTATAMGWDTPDIDPRLNEMDYFNLSQAMHAAHGVEMPGPDGFSEHVPLVLEAWHRAEIQGQESFAAFETRVGAVLREVGQLDRHVLCVTSGGVIGMVMRLLLALDPRRFAHVILPIRNTSVHRVLITPSGPILAGFNATPHLDPADRAHARTQL